MSADAADKWLTEGQIIQEFLYALDELIATLLRGEIDWPTYTQRKETLVNWSLQRLKYKQDAKVGKQLAYTAPRRRSARRNHLLGGSQQ